MTTIDAQSGRSFFNHRDAYHNTKSAARGIVPGGWAAFSAGKVAAACGRAGVCRFGVPGAVAQDVGAERAFWEDTWGPWLGWWCCQVWRTSHGTIATHYRTCRTGPRHWASSVPQDAWCCWHCLRTWHNQGVIVHNSCDVALTGRVDKKTARTNALAVMYFLLKTTN